jgi:hypothetical protein
MELFQDLNNRCFFMGGLSEIEDYKSTDYSMRQGNDFKADEVMSKKDWYRERTVMS